LAQDPSFFDRALRTFLEDSALWPVLAVVVLVAATLGATLLVLAIQDRSLPASGALALLGGAGLKGLVDAFRRRSFGAIGAVFLCIAALGAGLAAAYLRLTG
jgi:hypothetical protein